MLVFYLEYNLHYLSIQQKSYQALDKHRPGRVTINEHAKTEAGSMQNPGTYTRVICISMRIVCDKFPQLSFLLQEPHGG